MYNDIVIFLNKKLKNAVVVNEETPNPPQFSYSEELTDLGVINLNGYENNAYRQVLSVDLVADSSTSYPLDYSVWWVPTMKIIITDGEGNFYNESISGAGTIINDFYIGEEEFYINTQGITWPDGKSYTAYAIFDFYYD